MFADATSYMTTAASYALNSTQGPLYISAEWTPEAAAASAGFSIVTRAAAAPIAGTFDPGMTFRFFSTGASGANSISITDNGADVTGLTPTLASSREFALTFGETYLLELYDNGDEVWMQITQKDLTSNRAYAYAVNVVGDTTGTRVAFVNGAASESRLDNLVIGRPMMAVDTRGTGHVQASGNGENGTTTGTITMEGWFKARSLPTGSNTATLISQWDSAQLTRSSYRLYMTSGGALSLSLGSGSATTDTEALGVSLSTDTWTHVAVAFDDKTTYGTITVYLNGSLASTVTGTATNQILASNGIRTAQEQFMVGADHSGVTNADASGDHAQNIFDGLISDVRLWDDVRAADEIEEWYDRRLPLLSTSTTLTNLIVNWRFDQESAGFSATQVEDRPSAFGADGDLLHGAIWVGALLNTHRVVSTDVCGVGFRVGPFRCDFRTVMTNYLISGENLAGLTTFYAKVWGGGGGADTSGHATSPHSGGGGGFAGALFLNTATDITITVGTGGTSGPTAVRGEPSFLDYGTPRATGNRGNASGNTADGNGGIGVIAGSPLTSVINPSGTAVPNARPGCVPTITVIGSTCTDPHYTITNPTATIPAHPGYGADGPLTYHSAGQDGAVVLYW